MFPLDLILVSDIVRWMARKIYYKLFSTKFLPVADAVESRIGSQSLQDVYYTGTITEIQGDLAFIDGLYKFSTSEISQDVYVGNIVTCVINSHSAGSLSDITVIDILNTQESLDETVITNSKSHGVIVKRDLRTFTVSPGPLELNLDEVTTKFIPEVGDLVELQITKNVGGKNNISIFPRGYRTLTGTITLIEDDSGFINNAVVFQKHHCQPGYLPQKDDRVVLSVIRCQNGSTQFRALQVTPLPDRNRARGERQLLLQNAIDSFIFHPKEVICVNLDEAKLVNAELINTSSKEYKLIKMKAFTAESLIELVEPSDIELLIRPKSNVTFKFKVIVKYFGFSTINFEFVFDDLIFNCSLNFLAINKTNDFIMSQLDLNRNDSAENNAPSNNNRREKNINGESNIVYSDKAPIPGRDFRNPIKFFPVKMGFFDIPDKLKSILKDGERGRVIKHEVEAFCPCLQTGLQKDNYKIYMHCLLYLEELTELDRVKQLEVILGFEKKNDFLVLHVDENSNFSLLQSGDKVLARKPWEPDGDIFEGVVWRAQPRELHIKFSQTFHCNYVSRSEYILTFKLSRSQVRLKHQAVNDTVDNLGVKWLFPDQVSLKPPFIIQVNSEMEESGTRLSVNARRNIKWNRQGAGYGNRQSKHTFESKIPVERNRVIKWLNSDLNEEQKSAVVNCLGAESRPFPYIIFGPPGTGKSMTVVEICLQVYRLIPESRVLVVAPSNSATDQLCLSIISSGFLNSNDFVRLGSHRYISSGNIPEGLVQHTFLPELRGDCSDPFDAAPKINRNCIAEKRMVISTLGSVGALRTMGFPSGYFTHFIVDEAGQVTEPENMILAGLMSQDSHMILAGDPLQLGPVIFSSLAKHYNLHHSFLYRLMGYKPYMFDKVGFPNSCGYNPKFITKLVQSYRALPKLLELISTLFYRNELKAMISDSTSQEAITYFKVKELFPINSTIPIIFHSVSGKELIEEGTYSFYNNEEVFQICTYLTQLYRLGIRPYDVGIITPYISQVRKIVQFLDSLSQETPKIGSVEEFQGQERSIILLSTVRSSLILDPNLNQMSFIYSPQRINVAISRAKAVLIIVGNSTTLSNDDIWRHIVQYTIDNNSFRT